MPLLFSSIIYNGNTRQRYKQNSIGSYHGDAYPRKCKVTKKGDIPLHIALYSMPILTPY